MRRPTPQTSVNHQTERPRVNSQSSDAGTRGAHILDRTSGPVVNNRAPRAPPPGLVAQVEHSTRRPAVMLCGDSPSGWSHNP